MDKHFMVIVALGVIVLGIVGIVAGAYLTVITGEAAAGSACIGVGSMAIGALAGVFAVPKIGGSNEKVNTDSYSGN